MGRFELPASASRTQRATGLRYIPMFSITLTMKERRYFSIIFWIITKYSGLFYPEILPCEKDDNNRMLIRNAVTIAMCFPPHKNSIICIADYAINDYIIPVCR